MRTFALMLALTTLPTFSAMAAKPSAAKAPANSKMSYSCPMHPAEMSDHAGKCSKCGMALTMKDIKPMPMPSEAAPKK